MSPTTTPIPEDELLPPRYSITLQHNDRTQNVIELPPFNSFKTKVKQNKRITAEGHWQDVRHIILESDDAKLNYEAGDIAVIYPQNAKEEVDEFLNILHWTEIADIPLSITNKLTGTAAS